MAGRQPPRRMPRISLFEKICYGCGDAGATIIASLAANFLTFYYTDVVGFAPVVVSILFLAPRMFDIVSDSLIGILVDRTRTRWGRYRPYMLWTAVPVGLSCILTFQSPDFGLAGRIVYAALTYYALMLAYSCNTSPYCALITRMTDDTAEGAACQSVRFAMVAIASFAVSVGLPVMVREFGGMDAARGFSTAVAILALVSVTLFLVSFAVVRERLPDRPSPQQTIRGVVAGALQNDQLRLTFVMTFLLMAIFNTKGGAALYFITYVLHGDALYQALFFGIATAGGLAGSLGVQLLSRRFDARTIYVTVNLLLAAGHGLVYYMPAEYPIAWLLLVGLCCTLLGCTLPLHFTLIQLADRYGGWRFDTRSSGLSFALNLVCVKLAWAFAGALVSGTLVLVVYHAGPAHQTPLSLAGIRLLSTVIPGVMHLALAMVASRTRLNAAMIARMNSD